MKRTPQAEEIILHILRLSLIASRNLAHIPKATSVQRLMLREWAELGHGIPVLLLGRHGAAELNVRAVRWIADMQARSFCERYPDRNDAAFQQIAALLEELNAILDAEEAPNSADSA